MRQRHLPRRLNLAWRIQQRNEVGVTHQRLIARHQAGKDEDAGGGAYGLPQHHAFLGEGDKKGLNPGFRKRRADPRGTKAIGVGLHHRRRLHRRHRVQTAPVGDDRAEVDGQPGARQGVKNPWRRGRPARRHSVRAARGR